MEKNEIRDFLENNIRSHPNYIMDNNDRLVWMSDVIEAVDLLINTEKNENN